MTVVVAQQGLKKKEFLNSTWHSTVIYKEILYQFITFRRAEMESWLACSRGAQINNSFLPINEL